MAIVLLFFKTARITHRAFKTIQKRFPKSKWLEKKSAHFHMRYKIYWKKTRHQVKRFGHMWPFSIPSSQKSCSTELFFWHQSGVVLIVYRYLWVCILFSRSLPLSLCSWHLVCTLFNRIVFISSGQQWTYIKQKWLRLRYSLVCITIKNGKKSVHESVPQSAQF